MIPLNGTSLSGTALNGASVASVIVRGDRVPARGHEPSTTDERGPEPVDHRDPAYHSPAAVWPDPDLDVLDDELVRLDAEVVAAKERAEVAQDRAGIRDAELREMLRAELIACRETVDEMDREHELTVTMLRDAAQVETARILAEARERATRTTSGSVSASRPGVTDGE